MDLHEHELRRREQQLIVKSSEEQFLAAAADPPSRYRCRLSRAAGQGLAARKESEEAERTR